ncbi:MAG: hypothetical protein ACHRHE_06950 [Tepidisphaerales bacterium]
MKKRPPSAPAPAIPARRVLDALLEVRRLEADRALQRLEAHEPDLAEYLLEGLSALHCDLLGLGGGARATRNVYLEARQLVLVSIAAVRGGLGPAATARP